MPVARPLSLYLSRQIAIHENAENIHRRRETKRFILREDAFTVARGSR